MITTLPRGTQDTQRILCTLAFFLSIGLLFFQIGLTTQGVRQPTFSPQGSSLHPASKITQPGDCGEVSLEVNGTASHSLLATVIVTVFHGFLWGGTISLNVSGYPQTYTIPISWWPPSATFTTTTTIPVPLEDTLYSVNATINKVPAGWAGWTYCTFPTVSASAQSGPA